MYQNRSKQIVYWSKSIKNLASSFNWNPILTTDFTSDTLGMTNQSSNFELDSPISFVTINHQSLLQSEAERGCDSLYAINDDYFGIFSLTYIINFVLLPEGFQKVLSDDKVFIWPSTNSKIIIKIGVTRYTDELWDEPST